MSESVDHFMPKRNQRDAGIEFLDWYERAKPLRPSWLELVAVWGSIVALGVLTIWIVYRSLP